MATEELRDEVRRCGSRRRGRRLPAELKARLQSASRARWQQGERASQIAASLGISAETVRRWCTATLDVGPALVPVQVCAERRAAPAVRLISPGGWTLDGLDVESALAVLQRLG